MRSPGKQKGMTAIGWLLVLVFGGIFVYAGLILIPVYFEAYKISASMNSLVTDNDAHGKRPGELKSILLKRLDINMIYDIKPDDINITRSDSGGNSVEIDYEPQVKFIGNLYFVAIFDKTVDVPG